MRRRKRKKYGTGDSRGWALLAPRRRDFFFLYFFFSSFPGASQVRQEMDFVYHDAE